MGEDMVVAWSGNVDAETAPTLAHQLIENLRSGSADGVTIDLSGVTTMDSTGLGGLVQVSNAAGELGRSVSLRSTPPAVRRLLERVGLLAVFDLDDAAPRAKSA